MASNRRFQSLQMHMARREILAVLLNTFKSVLVCNSWKKNFSSVKRWQPLARNIYGYFLASYWPMVYQSKKDGTRLFQLPFWHQLIGNDQSFVTFTMSTIMSLWSLSRNHMLTLLYLFLFFLQFLKNNRLTVNKMLWLKCTWVCFVLVYLPLSSSDIGYKC